MLSLNAFFASRTGFSRLGVVAVFPLLATALGCPGSGPEVRKSSTDGRAAQRRVSQANVLLDAIAAQLRTLPESVQLELRPPTVLLDSRRSADGEDVEAVLTRPPEAPPGAPANVLRVPRGNARFVAIDVKPGDTVKYFVVPDRDTMDRFRASGEADIVTFAAVNLAVAQRLGDDALLVVGGLPQEITTPSKIEVWRTVDDRMNEISTRLERYRERRDPPLAWQPTADEAALGQMTERLNQWLRQRSRSEEAADEIPPDEAPLTDPIAAVATLSEALAGDERLQPYLSGETLARRVFEAVDTRQIVQAVWLRNIGSWACGEAADAAEKADALFDWTIRNVELVDEPDAAPHGVWELVLFGRGTAAQRAWVFAELCRQQRIPAAVLRVGSESDRRRTLVGVVDREALLLFDPELGLPLPGADGAATLAEVRDDDSPLRRLDLSEEAYPLTTEDFAAVTAELVADAFSLSDRAAALEAALSGADSLRLATDAAAESTRFAAIDGIDEVVLWAEPFETLRAKLSASPAARRQEVKRFLPYAWRPRLWKARSLHFRGRVAETEDRSEALSGDVNDLRAAQMLYMSPRVRPNKRRLGEIDSAVKREIYGAAKASATLWLGVLAYDRNDYENSAGWLEPALRNARLADRRGAIRYNLARAYEAQGDFERAAELLEADDSPQRVGNRVRAARLRERVEAP